MSYGSRIGQARLPDIDISPKRPSSLLQVVVTTSDIPDGAFDGVAYITLTGLEGSTAELPLVNSQPSNFGVKATDTFSIRAADVGAINSITIRIVSYPIPAVPCRTRANCVNIIPNPP